MAEGKACWHTEQYLNRNHIFTQVRFSRECIVLLSGSETLLSKNVKVVVAEFRYIKIIGAQGVISGKENPF